MTAYYNEIDEKAAAWLRELIRRDLIAPGDVDTRSIIDVRPDDLRGYTQCHFFAGIGVWSYALRRAGWPDDRPVWTGSCPCQPFSAAGKGGGFDDERHLWPHWYWLIGERRPDVVLGEQVASKDGLVWLDLVQADMEGARYAIGAVDTCAAGFGSPNIRQRLYWVGRYRQDPARRERGRERPYAQLSAAQRNGEVGRVADADIGTGGQGRTLGSWSDYRSDALKGSGLGGSGVVDGLANPAEPGWLARRRPTVAGDGRGETRVEPGRLFDAGGLADASNFGRGTGGDGDNTRHDRPEPHANGGDGRAGPTNGQWADADWLFCRDGKWRPVEPGAFPLAHGAPARVVRLRGYGNAINAAQAQGFIEAYLETKGLVIDGTAGHLRLTKLSDLTNDTDIFS